MTTAQSIATLVGAFASVAGLVTGIQRRRVKKRSFAMNRLAQRAQNVTFLEAERRAHLLLAIEAQKVLSIRVRRAKLAEIEEGLNRDVASQEAPARSAKWLAATVRKSRRTHADMSPWILGLMAPADAKRYAWEWEAHLIELIEEGELKQARRDRRRLALAAVTLAIVLRVRRALIRAH